MGDLLFSHLYYVIYYKECASKKSKGQKKNDLLKFISPKHDS